MLAQAQGAVDTANTILGQLDTLQRTLDTISRDLPGAHGQKPETMLTCLPARLQGGGQSLIMHKSS